MEEVRALERRDRDEEKEMERFIQEENAGAQTSETTTDRPEIVGRQTGTAEWKAARGEDGTSR